MTAPGTRTIEWANGEDQVCISKIAEILDLEDKCGASVFTVVGRLESSLAAFSAGMLGGAASFNDVRETIRLGLIGGGMSPDKALAAVKRWVDPPNPLAPNLLFAYEILAGYIRGIPQGEQVGKKAAAETASDSMTTPAGSADRQSSDLAQGLDGRHDKLNDAPSGKSAPPLTDTMPPKAESPIPRP